MEYWVIQRRVVFLLIAGFLLASCKRPKPARDVPQEGRVSAPATAPSAAPASRPAALPPGATFSEAEVVRFIAASRVIVKSVELSGKAIERSPVGFSLLVDSLRENDAIKAAFALAGMPLDAWSALGRRVWSAWSVAQVDFNSEAPLRDNAGQLARARAKLAQASATTQAGVRVMSAEERTREIAAARNRATDAGDRARMWSEKAADLRERIAAADNLPGVAADSPADAVAQSQRLGDIQSARAAMTRELAAAELNERQARLDARRATEQAEHPEQPLDGDDKAELLEESARAIARLEAEIAALQQSAGLLQARLAEDHRVNAEARKKAASQADIALVRRHLAEFDDAWGMTVEGRGK